MKSAFLLDAPASTQMETIAKLSWSGASTAAPSPLALLGLIQVALLFLLFPLAQTHRVHEPCGNLGSPRLLPGCYVGLKLASVFKNTNGKTEQSIVACTMFP